MAFHILVVDDSSHVQRMIREALSETDYEVSTAPHGEVALELCSRRRPDVILADLTMPRMGGLELCARIKATPSLTDVPVLLLVSPFDELDEQAVSRAGASGHLSKPLQAQTLNDTLEQLLLEDDAPSLMSIEDPEDEGGSGRLSANPLGEEQLPRIELTEISDLAEDLDPTDVPDPYRLEDEPAGQSAAWREDLQDLSPEQLSNLELSEADRDLSELASTGTEISGDALQVLDAEVVASVSDAVAAQVRALVAPGRLEPLVRQLLKAELRALLPEIVERVIREQVQAISKEIEALEGFGEES